jgi:hypothetical protein
MGEIPEGFVFATVLKMAEVAQALCLCGFCRSPYVTA